MKIAFGEEDATTVLRDERMRVGQFTARIVQLVPCAARKPHRGNTTVIERRSEFVKTEDYISVGRNQSVYRDIKD
jgi:hypothetical protein